MNELVVEDTKFHAQRLRTSDFLRLVVGQYCIFLRSTRMRTLYTCSRTDDKPLKASQTLHPPRPTLNTNTTTPHDSLILDHHLLLSHTYVPSTSRNV